MDASAPHSNLGDHFLAIFLAAGLEHYLRPKSMKGSGVVCKFSEYLRGFTIFDQYRVAWIVGSLQLLCTWLRRITMLRRIELIIPI